MAFVFINSSNDCLSYAVYQPVSMFGVFGFFLLNAPNCTKNVLRCSDITHHVVFTYKAKHMNRYLQTLVLSAKGVKNANKSNSICQLFSTDVN